MSNLTADIPSTSRAALFRGPGQQLNLVDASIPPVESGEVLVRIDCCTMCGSDLHTINGTRVEPTPSVLGHEVVGTVCSLGETPAKDINAEVLQQGDRVTWSPAVSCGSCDRCLDGLPQKCRELFKYGHAIANGRDTLSGGLAEYILLRRGSAIIKLQTDDPVEVFAPASCAAATAAAAIREASEVADTNLLIFGAGMLGLTAAAMAKTFGAKRVTVCDPDPNRLERAADFGADRVVQWRDSESELWRQLHGDTSDSNINVILELSGAVKAVEAALWCGDIGARIVLVGSVMDSPPAQFDPTSLVRKCLSVRGVHNYTPPDLATAVGFLQQHHAAFPFAKLVERTFPLSEINEAVEFAHSQRPIRIAIQP